MCRLLTVRAEAPFDARAHLEKFALVARNSKEYQELRNKHSRGEYDDIPVCAACEVNTPRSDPELSSVISEHQPRKDD